MPRPPRTPRSPSKPARRPSGRKAIAATTIATVAEVSAHGEVGNLSFVMTDAKLRADWQDGVSEILEDARAVMKLYEGLNAIFALPKGDLARGDNRASERAEAIAAFEEDKQTAAITAEILQGQLESRNPQPKIIEQNSHVFRTLANAAKFILLPIIAGYLGDIGKTAHVHHGLQGLGYAIVPSLASPRELYLRTFDSTTLLRPLAPFVSGGPMRAVQLMLRQFPGP